MASSVQANINNSRNATGRLLQKAAYKIELPEEYQNNSSTKTVSSKGKASLCVTQQGSATKPYSTPSRTLLWPQARTVGPVEKTMSGSVA
ncbi:hypothetical protein FOMA001_g5646 [Fusarium oxysporum f. sp. matthiolae]|nr:hypothetical protein FOMA001_g5646 [Fusarium oxysporum f. sp. matthiolae]